MKTITVQIGNSDDKLTQKDWSEFVVELGLAIKHETSQIHFFGSSDSCAPWQNAAWVFEVEEGNVGVLGRKIAYIRSKYEQDSVAWTEGKTSFI